MTNDFFPARPPASPTIYAYEDTNPLYAGLLKIGYTNGDVRERVATQYPTLRPGEPPYVIHLEESAMRADGTAFTDRDVHRVLRKKGLRNEAGEWFKCSVEDVKAAIIALVEGKENEENRTRTFPMRPEQECAVKKTARYFKDALADDATKPSHFLWNAKMRFGKTFASYQLAKKMGWKRTKRVGRGH